MCISNNFIEQQAYRISEEIRKNSVYRVVGVDASGVSDLSVNQQNDHWNGKDLITKVILEDKDGRLYYVKPDDNGLMFSKGEITYKEYGKRQKKEDVKGISYFFVSIGFIFILMITLLKFLS